MNRVLHDMPEEPMIYLLRTLYKKSGMEIPQDIRYGGLRKSVDLVRSRSPDRASKGAVLSASDGALAASREYEKPWLSQMRRMKPRKSTDELEAGKIAGKKRPEWHGDTKVIATSFDELFEDQDGGRREAASPGKRSRPQANPRSSWASVGLEAGDSYASGDYRGPGCRLNQGSEEDLIAAEIIRASARYTSESLQFTENVASYRNGQKLDTERHRRELENVLLSGSTENRATTAPSTVAEEVDNEDEAIELLEDADDLLREGVKNVPKSGYKLSRVAALVRSAMKWQNTALKEGGNEPYIKLNINLNPFDGPRRVDSMQSFGGYESDQENESPAVGGLESDEEFESVSQVIGPRHPVWQVPESDGESVGPRGHKRRTKHKEDKRAMASTAPAAIPQMALSAGDLDPTQNLTWSAGLRVQTEESSPEPEREEGTDLVSATSGGWALPDDSDAASLHDWNQRVKGKVRDPRAY